MTSKRVSLCGWVGRRRDHGGVIFVDLRDLSGFVQIVFNPEHNEKTHQIAESLRSEWVIGVSGIVKERTPENVNPNLPTGEIEIFIDEIEIYNKSETPPFKIEDNIETNEELRLKYRFLDLRRPSMQQNFIQRHKITSSARKFLNENQFLDIETPMLNKSTPEGARDYLVPSRVNPGHFYALPQSPQIFKQILMVSGFDRYYQIVKCFRDEDMRADRQAEFTQIDLEMSFINKDDIIALMEKMFKQILSDCYNIKIKIPFPRISYRDAIEKYGTDAPDIRYGLEIVDVADIASKSDFKVFKTVLSKGGRVCCINAVGGHKLSRKDIDDLTSYVSIFGAKGLAWMRVTENGLESVVAKFFDDDLKKELMKKTNAKKGDLLLFVADTPKIVFDALGNLRKELAKRLELLKYTNEKKFIWVIDFPLFEWSEEDERYYSMHHPFTSPIPEHIEKLETNPEEALSNGYDLVLNGIELGGGSIRIHDIEVQKKIFEILNISDEEADEKFGFLLEALKYGAPPHGGIAFGLDRTVMMFQDEKSLRDVIAFPKTQKGVCLMSEAPSKVNEEQLEELSITLELDEEELFK